MENSPALAPIFGLRRDDTPHPTTRVRKVAGEAWDEIDVKRRHCVPGSRAIVDADVEAIWTELSLRGGLRIVEQGQHFRRLLAIHLDERADVPSRDDKAMARRNREPSRIQWACSF